MHHLFNPENKFWNFVGKLADVCMMSILWAVTCIPLFTVGAATTAFYSFTVDQVKDLEGSVWQSYFSAFKQNFKKSTLIWLLQLAVGGLLGINLYAAWHFYVQSGIVGLGLLSLAVCGTLIYLMISIYVYPVLACYDFPIKKVITDSFIMAMGNLHVSITVLVLFVLAAVGIYYISGLFFFWIGLAIFFSSYFIWGVFMKLAGFKPPKRKKKNKLDPTI